MIQKVLFNKNKEIIIDILRDDLLHPIISGNKFRKLKYNIIKANSLKVDTLVTFGGAFSNHILAVAGAGKEYGYKTIGIIRGEELVDKINENPTLKASQDFGMEFVFVSREEYRNKDHEGFVSNLLSMNSNYYVLPEGGTNDLAIKGCEEILTEDMSHYTHICCSVGTGGTISGIINSSSSNQKIIGFSSLKGNFLSSQISNFVSKDNWEINSDYHFGGYGKVNEDLISFMNSFFKETNIPLDPVYTGKMAFGVFDLIKQGFFPKDSRILMIHTGGLQGIKGMNNELKKKNKEIINYDI